jgi:phosphoribosylaminoimidazole carboxylase PurE protein
MSNKGRGKAAILMGSDSDLDVMAEAAKVFEKIGVEYELEVTSAHRSPERTAEIVGTAPERGVRVFIAGAGHAAHLAGVVASKTTLPVLGVPLASSDLKGLDSLLATVMMPAGIPVGTLAIGKAGAANAAWLAAQIIALEDDKLAARLSVLRTAMAGKVAKKSEAAKTKLASLLND